MSDRTDRWRNMTVDGLAWLIVGLAVGTAAVAVLAAAVAFAVGGDALIGLKQGLFLGGWVVMAVGALMLRPKRYEDFVAEAGGDEDGREDATARRDDPGAGRDRPDAGRDGRPKNPRGVGLEREAGPPPGGGDPKELVQSVPPARWLPVPEDDRLPDGARLIVVGAGMLALSFLLELAGVGVGLR